MAPDTRTDPPGQRGVSDKHPELLHYTSIHALCGAFTEEAECRIVVVIPQTSEPCTRAIHYRRGKHGSIPYIRPSWALRKVLAHPIPGPDRRLRMTSVMSNKTSCYVGATISKSSRTTIHGARPPTLGSVVGWFSADVSSWSLDAPKRLRAVGGNRSKEWNAERRDQPFAPELAP